MNKNILAVGIILLSLTAAVSCGGKKETKKDVVEKKAESDHDSVKRMSDDLRDKDTKWLGKTYTVSVVRKADSSLKQIKLDDGTVYYDNSITLRVLRADGSEFFKRTFTKEDFKNYIDGLMYERGALLGLVFTGADGNNLIFSGSVGSPDPSSDEYEPVTVKVSNFGSVTISKDNGPDANQMDMEDDENIE